MNESNIKNELLRQNGSHTADAEVAQLRKMVEAEDRRARRLMRWAIGAWLLFFAIIVVALGLPMIQAHTSPSMRTDSAGVPVPLAAPMHHAMGVFAAIVGLVIGTAFFVLPIVAITLTIMALMARRTAGKRQILTALASIEAQLRLLTSTKGPSSGA